MLAKSLIVAREGSVRRGGRCAPSRLVHLQAWKKNRIVYCLRAYVDSPTWMTPCIFHSSSKDCCYCVMCDFFSPSIFQSSICSFAHGSAKGQLRFLVGFFYLMKKNQIRLKGESAHQQPTDSARLRPRRGTQETPKFARRRWQAAPAAAAGLAPSSWPSALKATSSPSQYASLPSPPPLAADFWRRFCFLLLHLLLSRQDTSGLSSWTRFSLEGCAFNLIPSVFVLQALAAAFARGQQEYAVVFITHSAHRVRRLAKGEQFSYSGLLHVP